MSEPSTPYTLSFTATVIAGQKAPYARVCRWSDGWWLDPADPTGKTFIDPAKLPDGVPTGGWPSTPQLGVGYEESHRFAIPFDREAWAGGGVGTVFVHVPGIARPVRQFEVEFDPPAPAATGDVVVNTVVRIPARGPMPGV